MTSRLCLVATIHSMNALTGGPTISYPHRTGSFKAVFLTGSRTLSLMLVGRWLIPQRQRATAWAITLLTWEAVPWWVTSPSGQWDGITRRTIIRGARFF